MTRLLVGTYTPWYCLNCGAERWLHEFPDACVHCTIGRALTNRKPAALC